MVCFFNWWEWIFNEFFLGNICEIFVLSCVMGFWLNVNLFVGKFVKLILIIGFGKLVVVMLFEIMVCLWYLLFIS